MLKIFLILLLFITSILCQRGYHKPGDCPPLPDVGICQLSCFSDLHCGSDMKCCRTACGGSFCTSPITSRKPQVKEKPGYCPVKASGPWVCSSRCAFDGDCRGTKKCCKNRCGAMACTRPEIGLN